MQSSSQCGAGGLIVNLTASSAALPLALSVWYENSCYDSCTSCANSQAWRPRVGWASLPTGVPTVITVTRYKGRLYGYFGSQLVFDSGCVPPVPLSCAEQPLGLIGSPFFDNRREHHHGRQQRSSKRCPGCCFSSAIAARLTGGPRRPASAPASPPPPFAGSAPRAEAPSPSPRPLPSAPSPTAPAPAPPAPPASRSSARSPPRPSPPPCPSSRAPRESTRRSAPRSTPRA